jgi:hypothetical protein
VSIMTAILIRRGEQGEQAVWHQRQRRRQEAASQARPRFPATLSRERPEWIPSGLVQHTVASTLISTSGLHETKHLCCFKPPSLCSNVMAATGKE